MEGLVDCAWRDLLEVNDTQLLVVGEGPVRPTTDGGADNCLRHFGDQLAPRDLSHRIAIHLRRDALNENDGFRGGSTRRTLSPWILPAIIRRSREPGHRA
jgi:hypothetical protein